MTLSCTCRCTVCAVPWHMWLTSFDSLCVSRRSLHQPRAESFNGITQRNNLANGAPRPIRRQATTATCAPSAAADRSRSPVQQQESQESRDADSPVLGLTQRAFSDNNFHTYPWYLRSVVVVVLFFVDGQPREMTLARSSTSCSGMVHARIRVLFCHQNKKEKKKRSRF